MSGERGREPAISERTSRRIAGAFVLVLVAAFFVAMVMLLAAGLIWLYGGLFG